MLQVHPLAPHLLPGQAAAVYTEANLLCMQLQRIATEGAFAGLVGGSPVQTQASFQAGRKELQGVDHAKVTACVAGAGAIWE